jgi:hypothetical protein
MLRSIESLCGYKISAFDGEIGKVHEFLFDDEQWTIRYVVVDTGRWIPGRRVLISPAVFGQPDWDLQQFPVSLTKEQVKNSPDINVDKPVSRRHELELLKYYGISPYWPYVPASGYYTVPPPVPLSKEEREELESEKNKEEIHLRSTREVIGYHIQATDDTIGHVVDFILEDEKWVIRYMVVDTRNWLPGKKVLVSPHWIKDIRWTQTKVYVDLSKEAVKNSPEYDPSEPVNREYELRLYDYYGRPKYWGK